MAERDELTKRWAAATEKFLHSKAGASWPGGIVNMTVLSRILEANGRAKPSVENITRAYRLMKRRGLLVANPE